jgi:hypothetical protein
VDGVWVLHMLSFDLPLHITLSIRATPIRIASDGKDTLSWNSNVNGVFDTKDAYLLAAVVTRFLTVLMGNGYGN